MRGIPGAVFSRSLILSMRLAVQEGQRRGWARFPLDGWVSVS